MIYADNAATSRLDPEAFSAMKEFLTEDYANPSQPYSFSRNSKKAIKTSRERIAECIDAEPDEIFFTSGGCRCRQRRQIPGIPRHPDGRTGSQGNCPLSVQ